jgi:Mrp family chromosome partitioning ATPase
LTALLSDDELPFSSYLCESGIPNLRVLPAGQATANPTNLFTAHRLTVLLDRFEDTDLLLLDGPAILDAPDALLLARLSDLVLLVVRAGRTRYSDVTQSCTQLQQLGAQIGGIVLNHTLQRWIRRNRKSSRAIQRGTSQHERAEDWHPSAHPPA